MHRRHLLALSLATPHVARAQAATLRLIVPFAPGGASDTTARIIQPGLAAALGRTIVIENRAGASGSIGTRLVVQAPPDGSVIGISNTSPHGIVPLAMQPPPYDGDRDFTHIAMVADTPTVMLLPGNSGFRSFAELRAAAAARPQGLTYGSSGVGGMQHLQGEMMAKLVGGRWVHVPYRGTGPGLQATIAGEVDCFLTPMAGTTGAIEAGQVRAIAVSTAQPFPALPGVPTYEALGLPALTVSSWTGISGPRGMPPAMVAEMHAAMQRVLADPDTERRLIAAGLYPLGRTVSSAEYQQVHADFARVWGPVVREARISLE
ncbi:tripartite tricarboxylate transporter substrate binding protein [Roseococcus sp. SDR]|uniref:Bug family tripartite tricarboxylate transporter substrate binding protein n=1 Tax=Roseococcus sp. SDR TaxID=2835532 RepID=UPI001BD02984|nr:tripartite tricarboxylate transporter substrate binding protein [Roseococcus sp. SDR]MBS7790772.1 tripartite tricarboxylate transporter substrate binding protein [Roseococcus sp. SDR]MBV1846086.1 tripartite tricarboxylate transporter substrate binding protein [Roseococcus sp. SDR]